MPDKYISFDERIYGYFKSLARSEPEVLRRLREETEALPNAQMQISPEQGQFMALLLRLMNARKTLEVGVFTGYSSLLTALTLPSDGRVIACDVSDEWTSVASRYWREAGVENKIELRLAPAVETLDKLIAEGQNGAFDFAFIDADKKNNEAYFERALTLVRRGGLVAIDNTLRDGRVADESVQDDDTIAVRAFNQKLRADERVLVSLVPIADGLTLALKLE